MCGRHAIGFTPSAVEREDASGGQEWGLTWELRDFGGARLVFRGGATNGQTSAFLMVPARGFAITLLTNADQGSVLHTEVTRWAFGHYLGLDEPEPRILEMSERDLAPYLGRYVGAGSTSDARGEFLRNPDGSIAWLRWSRIRARLARAGE